MPKQILIVDDSPVVRKALRKLLDGIADWEVCAEAADGKEAITKAQECNPDVIILDLSMPVMNGLEAARVLKRVHPAMPLIMYTSFYTPHLVREALAAGCSAVASKAESPRRLVESMRQVLGGAA